MHYLHYSLCGTNAVDIIGHNKYHKCQNGMNKQRVIAFANNTYLQDGRHPLRGALVLRHDNAKKRDPSNNRWQLPFMKNLFLYKSVRKTEASWFHADIYQDNI